MLSGTPLVNRGDEMWSYLHPFDPVLFPDAAKFRRMYSDYTGAGFHTGSVSALLKQALKHRMIRRSSEEVGLQLPELNEMDVVLKHNPEQAKAYEQMKNSFYVWLEQAEGEGKLLTAQAIIAQLTRLLQINVWPVVEFDIKDGEGTVIGRDRIDIRDSSKLDEVMEIFEKAGEERHVRVGRHRHR